MLARQACIYIQLPQSKPVMRNNTQRSFAVHAVQALVYCFAAVRVLSTGTASVMAAVLHKLSCIQEFDV